MRFAPSGYTERGGIGTIKAHAKVQAARAALATPVVPEAEAEEEPQRRAA